MIDPMQRALDLDRRAEALEALAARLAQEVQGLAPVLNVARARLPEVWRGPAAQRTWHELGDIAYWAEVPRVDIEQVIIPDILREARQCREEAALLRAAPPPPAPA
jgi:hypothetical protein